MTKWKSAYMEALVNHLEGCPDDISEYVLKRLVQEREEPIEDGAWMAPIKSCGFNWRKSEEGSTFWRNIHEGNWNVAKWSDFWQQHTKDQKPQIQKEKYVYLVHVVSKRRDRPWQGRTTLTLNKKITSGILEDIDLMVSEEFDEDCFVVNFQLLES